jgi:hypothetical protein
LNAAKILARVGDVRRFRSAAAFASYTGTAPIEQVMSSPTGSPGPKTASSTVVFAHHGHHPDPPRRTWSGLLPAQTRQREGSQGSPALSEEAAVRPRLSPAAPRHHPPSSSGSGRTPGGVYETQRGRLNPYRRLFGTVTSRTHRRRHYIQSRASRMTQRGAVQWPHPDLGVAGQDVDDRPVRLGTREDRSSAARMCTWFALNSLERCGAKYPPEVRNVTTHRPTTVGRACPPCGAHRAFDVPTEAAVGRAAGRLGPRP